MLDNTRVADQLAERVHLRDTNSPCSAAVAAESKRASMRPVFTNRAASLPDQLQVARPHAFTERCPSPPNAPADSTLCTNVANAASIRRRSRSSPRANTPSSAGDMLAISAIDGACELMSEVSQRGVTEINGGPQGQALTGFDPVRPSNSKLAYSRLGRPV